MVKKSLCGLTADEIFSLIGAEGYKYSHAVSIANSLYKRRTEEISKFTKISGKLRDLLEADTFPGILKPVSSQVSSDKTVKYLFRNDEGKEFETVYLPDRKRNTVCVSSQSGCRMGCPFCVTARYGFRGNLSAGEIVSQISGIPDSEKTTHVVFMGMGEPMDNLENVLKACRIITAEWGLAISSRNFTVSTVGITPGIEEYLERSDCNLTFSLHSPFAEERKMVIPVEQKYTAERILDIMKNYPLKKKRRLSIAYVMIKDLNDTNKHLEEIISLLKGSAIRVNLLPYHAVENDTHTSSAEEKMHHFKHSLVISGISASVRKSRGADISAACGLLATGLK